jgi:hypothetical protein
LIDEVGHRYGSLLVTAPAGSKFFGRRSKAAWWCVCDCGARFVVVGAKLREREGNTAQSCCCAWRLTPERAREVGARARKAK